MRVTVTIIALLAAVIVAQPLVNAPVMPRYNYLTEGSAFVAGGATAEVASSVGNWVFGATAKGFYAMNGSMPSAPNPMPAYFDALNGSTANLIWTISESRVFVIADNLVLLYGYNSTMVWRVAMYRGQNVSFNLLRHSATPSNSIDYPVWAGGMIIVGTYNTSNNVAYPASSAIMAFNTNDLTVAWTTIVPYYETNFPGTWTNGSAKVWFLANGAGDMHLLSLWVSNGTVSQDIDTNTNDYARVNQEGDVVAITSRDNTVVFYGTNGSLLYTYNTYSCYDVRYPPFLINMTWFGSCDGYVYMFSISPIKYVGYVYASNDFTAGTVNMYNQDIVLFSSNNVYKLNVTRQFTKLISFNLTQSSSITPIAAAFIPAWWNMHEMAPPIIHVSYTGYYGGSVIAYDYMTNTVVGQLVGRLTPVGRAWLTPFTADGGKTYDWRVFVASASTDFIQGFDIVHTNVSFVAEIDSYSFVDVPSVTEKNSSTTYVFTYQNMYIVDASGNVMKSGTTVPFTYLETSVPPFIVGDYVCAINTYGWNSNTYCYNMKTAAWSTFAMCQSLTGTLPIVQYNKFIITCTSYFDSAVAVADVTGTAVTLYTGSSAYRTEACLMGNLVVVQTGLSTLSAFDITKSSTTAVWTVTSTSWLYVYSNAVTDGTYVYVVGYAKITPGIVNTHQSLFKISKTGSVVSQMYLPFVADVVRLRLKTGPNFGPSGVVYMFGAVNITAVDVGTMTTLFWVYTNTTISFLNLGAGTVLDSGAVCFYGTDLNFHVYSGFNGASAWMKPVYALGLQIVQANTSIYFSTGRTIVAADMYTGAEHAAVGYGTTFTPGSFSLAWGTNNTISIVTAGNSIVVAAGTNYYPYAAAGFSGGAPANGGNGGDATSDNKKTIIIIVVVVVVVVLIAVVVVALKSKKSDTNEDYVPMNPAAQV